jgi:hypothetical protein
VDGPLDLKDLMLGGLIGAAVATLLGGLLIAVLIG